ncbi:MAG: hypothetical protein AAB449_00295 [Patescibacteria group bacterium]
MPERNKKFHEIALQSSLFKGRSDWYFCYLKAEKIAHVLSLLADRSPQSHASLIKDSAELAGELPSTLVHFAAGGVEKAMVLADLFSLLSHLRLMGTNRTVSTENVAILTQELEQVVERIATEDHPSPFITSADFSVPSLADRFTATPLLASKIPTSRLKDIHKGQSKGQNGQDGSKGQKRSIQILDFIRTGSKRASIKDIVKIVTDCSEKTIQRELGYLIDQGLIKKEGERRWSVYVAV